MHAYHSNLVVYVACRWRRIGKEDRGRDSGILAIACWNDGVHFIYFLLPVHATGEPASAAPLLLSSTRARFAVIPVHPIFSVCKQHNSLGALAEKMLLSGQMGCQLTAWWGYT